MMASSTASPEVVLRRRLQLLQHEGGDLGRRVDLVVDLDVDVAVGGLHQRVGDVPLGLLHFGRIELAADEPLHREHGVLRVGQGLALGDLAHQALALGGEADDRRRGARAFLVGDDLGAPPSITATQELVVPRSMPIILPTTTSLWLNRTLWRIGVVGVSVSHPPPPDRRPVPLGHLHQGRAQQPVLVRVPLAERLDRGPAEWPGLIVGEGLVALGIERLARGVLDDDPLALQERDRSSR